MKILLVNTYSAFIKRFYTGKNWTRKFVHLIFQSPDSAFRMIKNLPAFLKMKKDFEPMERH